VDVLKRVMRNGGIVRSTAATGSVTVSFGERFQASEQFDVVFREGMAMVERTAAYLEGPGRVEAKSLTAPTNVLYATESMRLTTRLLDLASWLLVRRAVKSGEIDDAEAARKQRRIKLHTLGRSSHVLGFGELPEGLQALIEESYALHDRIVSLDRAMNVKLESENSATHYANPVGMQIDRLRLAFGG